MFAQLNAALPVSRRAALRNPLRLLVSAEPWLAAPFMLLTQPLYYRADGGPTINDQWRIDTLPEALGVALLGIPLLLATPYILVGVGRGHAWLARNLLGTNREAALEARVEQLAESR